MAGPAATALPFERQLLSGDGDHDIVEVVEHLAGLNAQTKRGPTVGLWTRLGGVDQAELDALLGRYELVRANLLRATVHLVTRRQLLAWRTALQPTLARAVRQYCPGIWDAADEAEVLEAGRDLLHRHDGLTRTEIGRHLHDRFPRVSDPRHLGFAIRMLVPVVEKAATPSWTAFRTRYVLAEDVMAWSPMSADEGRRDLVDRFLASFGPAGLADVTYWSGVTGLADAWTGLGPRNAPADVPPGTDTTPRRAFVLPEFDNLFFCRKASEAPLYQAKKRPDFRPARMPGSLVCDGEVVGSWTATQTERTPQLTEWTSIDDGARAEWARFCTWFASVS